MSTSLVEAGAARLVVESVILWRDFFGRLERAQLGSEVRDNFLGGLAVASAIYGDAEKAVGFLDRVRNARVYVDAALGVAAELCLKGFTEKAEELVRECLRRESELSPGEVGALAPRFAYIKTLTEGVAEGLRVAEGEGGLWRCRAILAVASAIIDGGMSGLDDVLDEFNAGVRWVFDEERAGILLEAGRLLLEAGKAEAARGMLRKAAEDAVNLYDDFLKRMILSSLVPVMIDAGMFGDAVVLSGVLGLAGLKYLERIGEAAGASVVDMPFYALDAYGKAVLALKGAEVSLSSGAIARAAEFIGGLSGRSWYPELLARLAAVQAKTGEKREGEVNVRVALELARGAQLVRVAEVVAEEYAGHAEGALERACREAEGVRKDERVLVLMRAAAAWSRIGREEKAAECFEEAAKLTAELGSGELFVELSRSLASSRSPEEALRLLRWLDEESRLALLAQTASFLVEEGRVEEGVKLAEAARLMAERGAAALPSMIQLAAAFSRKGMVGEAQKIAPVIAEGIVKTAARGGVEALRLLNLALGLAPRLRLLARREEGKVSLVLLNKGGGCVNVRVETGGLTASLEELGSKGVARLELACSSISPFDGRVKVKFEDAFGVEECVFRLRALT